MNQRLLPILLIAGAVALAGCQGPAPLAARARYPQRDLTAPWPERHYWPVPPSSFPAPPTAADENAGRAPDALPATASPLAAPGVQPTARPLQPAPRTRLGRVPRPAGAPRGC
jgi:hypothetical protein